MLLNLFEKKVSVDFTLSHKSLKEISLYEREFSTQRNYSEFRMKYYLILSFLYITLIYLFLQYIIHTNINNGCP